MTATQPRRVLVTGASGFVGSHLCRELLARGHLVEAVTRAPSRTQNAALRWHQLDLTDHAATVELLRRLAPDVVVHLAGLVTGTRDIESIPRMFEANSAATVHLLDASQRAGVARFLMAGSMEEPDLVAEAPASPYAASKAAAHLFASLYGVLSDLEVVHLQMFMVYGPGQRDETKLVPYVIRSLLAGQSPQLRSAGRPIDWIHVADVVEGIVRCIEAEAAPAAAVPLGTGRLHTVQELVELVVDAMGRPAEPVYSDWPDRPREMVRAADVERAARLLDGWSPRLALREGLEDTIAWYRAHPRAPA